MTKKRLKTIGKISAYTAAAVFIFTALYSGLTVRNYVFYTDKLKKPVRLVLITDLHGCYYGKNQSGILAKIREQNPDAVVMAGDIADRWYPIQGSIDFIKGIGGKYPCYYAAGNHEYQSGKMDKIKDIFRSYGVKVLAGESAGLTVDGQTVTICGVDDPESGENRFKRQLESALSPADTERYTVLLSHRPERIRQYAKYGCDLVLSGHAHGGQWRIPFLANGVIAPNQGLFPKYAGGEYHYGGVDMVVSRGLARESTPIIPRVFNPPELVVIDILPRGGEYENNEN